jgi:hypothetical protein
MTGVSASMLDITGPWLPAADDNAGRQPPDARKEKSTMRTVMQVSRFTLLPPSGKPREVYTGFMVLANCVAIRHLTHPF